MDHNVMGLKANKLIMEATMAGHGEGRGAIELNYRIVGFYLLAHIVDLDSHEEYFRVFKCPGEGYVEKKLIMKPSYIAEEYKCVYDSVENSKRRVVLHMDGDEWMDYVRSSVKTPGRNRTRPKGAANKLAISEPREGKRLPS